MTGLTQELTNAEIVDLLAMRADAETRFLHKKRLFEPIGLVPEIQVLSALSRAMCNFPEPPSP
jgi:hypothetical protein